MHLDTNFLIQALIPGSAAEAKVTAWINSDEALGISTIAWSEFLCGPLTLQDQVLARSFLNAIEPFQAEDASKAAELFNLTGRRSRSFADCQIAALALRAGARVATGNVADFSPFQAYGLVLA